ncbi:hypothetical protein Tco_1298564 [Tanacetum coccineum]
MMSKKMAELEDDFREFKAHTKIRFVSLDMSIRAYDPKKIRDMEEEDQRHDERFDGVMNEVLYFSLLIHKSSSPVQSSPLVTTKVPAVTTTVHAKPIQNSPLSDDLTSDPNKKATEKGVRKEGFGCALNMSKGSHLGLSVWTKSKSRVVIEVGQTEAIDGGLNCDNRLQVVQIPMVADVPETTLKECTIKPSDEQELTAMTTGFSNDSYSCTLKFNAISCQSVRPMILPLSKVNESSEWASASGPLLTGSSLLAALFKAREDDERHQESR